jgi:carbon-monoxide dehydrogenase large subunit
MTGVMGTPRLRKEDPKLLTGEGKYVDDIHAPGELWMGMVRSPMAHATIRSIDMRMAGDRRHGQPAALPNRG